MTERRLAGFGVYLDRRVASLLFLGFSSGLPLALTGATLFVDAGFHAMGL